MLIRGLKYSTKITLVSIPFSNITRFFFIDQTIYLYSGGLGTLGNNKLPRGHMNGKVTSLLKEKEGVCVHESRILLTWIMKVFVYIACGQYSMYG